MIIETQFGANLSLQPVEVGKLAGIGERHLGQGRNSFGCERGLIHSFTFRSPLMNSPAKIGEIFEHLAGAHIGDVFLERQDGRMRFVHGWKVAAKNKSGKRCRAHSAQARRGLVAFLQGACGDKVTPSDGMSRAANTTTNGVPLPA